MGRKEKSNEIKKIGRVSAEEKETRKVQRMTTCGLLCAPPTHPKDPHYVA